MEKELKISLQEYEDMKAIMKEQKNAIDELMKNSNIIVVDDRMHKGRIYHNTEHMHYTINTPTIKGHDELAKQCLQKEFDELYANYLRLENRYAEAIESWRKAEKESKKKWYHKIF